MTINAFILLATSFALSMGSRAQDVAADSELLFRGCGGVYFPAELGELEIEVFKRNTRRGGRDYELHYNDDLENLPFVATGATVTAPASTNATLTDPVILAVPSAFYQIVEINAP